MLGRKQNISNADWLNVAAQIEELISWQELKAAVDLVVADIKNKTAGKKAAYAWSGGKDSLVLGHICEQAGIVDSMLAVCDLEYPAFLKWLMANKPSGCAVINTGQNLDWLAKHTEMLFPQNSAVAGRWFAKVQHKAQRCYFKQNNLDVLLLGRRRADGNFVGRGDNIYMDSKGVSRYSPLADWSHEQILAYIHYHKLTLPPIYDWKNGYLCGTHPWPARQWTGSEQNGWQEIYDIDKDIVITAADKLESARIFLREVQV